MTEDDVKRWSTRERGPEKIVAVLTHDKYDPALRVDAALELVRMKARNGRRIGIGLLTDGLAGLSPDERKRIVAGLTPTLVAEMKKPAPAAQAGGAAPPDPSIPYKDAAFALLTYDRAALVSDDADRKKLQDALAEWCTSDFERRLDNSSQNYGVEQMLRALGAGAVKALPALINNDSQKYDRIATLVAEVGDAATKNAASAKLVDLAKYVSSKAWADKTRPIYQAQDDAAKLKVTEAQLTKQVEEGQDDLTMKVFAAIKKIGERPAIEFCLAFATDKAQTEKRRQAAVAALEGRLDRSNAADVQRILALASGDETPDSVRELAFARVGDMPRDQVVGKLYELFGHKKWKVRAVAAQTVLKMSTPAQIAEFMSKLPAGPAPGFAMDEALTYGSQIRSMPAKDGVAPKDVIAKFLQDGSVAARTTALGYYYAGASPAELPAVTPLEADKMPVPKVDGDSGKWVCEVPKPGGKETEQKTIATVGDFVQFCVKPAMAAPAK